MLKDGNTVIENNNDEKKSSSVDFQVKQEDGLQIAYDQEDLEREYPHLISEVLSAQQSLRINSVSKNAETINTKKAPLNKKKLPMELVNPGAIDFIRRCKKREEALEILEYLKGRKEISSEDYESYKHQINKKD
ncbi:MAG: DUF2095 family protein, partial [Promethearchaeota archaeon]